MKRFLSIFLAAIIFLMPLKSIAVNIPGYEGGIQNENTYKEVIFITGEPIVMEGTLEIKTKDKGNTRTEQYVYKLSNIEKDAELKRTIKLSEDLTTKNNQTTSTKTLDKYKETVTVGKKKYEVKDENYQWNQGTIVYNAPVVSCCSGDWSARKTYVVDKGKEEVTVQTIGNLVGYDSPWSGTETQTLEYTINYEEKKAKGLKWEGRATVEVSHNMTKDYAYSENVPNQISFKGGYLLTEQQEDVLKYNYDLPRLKGSTILKGRNTGKDSFSVDTNPIIQRLNIPAMRDVLGHKDEKPILFLASMEAFPLDKTYFGPSSPMSRGDFARAIAKAMNVEIEKEQKKKKGEEEKLPIYIDVGKNHKNYPYIEAVSKKGIMEGVGNGRFEPDRSLTRVEATAILVRLLGFKNLAPIYNYSTGFKDDKNIPLWAKDYVYVAKELDIIDRGQYFYPNDNITKGESADLIVRFINYLQNDLRYDYRENILNN